MINFEKKVLSNGLRVILAPMSSTEAVTLLVLVKVGSRYETKNINGISHFLEHLFFKGTKKRPEPGQVLKDLNKIGADHNAFTSKEITGYWVKLSAKDFVIGLDVVSDILLESLFKGEEIEKERGVIMREIDMIEDNPPRKIQSTLENVIFGDQPIGWNVAGDKEIVRKIKREDIIKYEADNYLSQNMVVVVAGDLNKKTTFKKISDFFGKVRKGKNQPFKKTETLQTEPRAKILKKESDQTHFTLAFRAYDMFDKRRHALNLLSVILGGNSSSRLFTEIREKSGLAYYVYSWADQYEDCGYLGLAAGIPHEKLAEVAQKSIAIAKEIKEKGVSKDDLSFAKSFLRGQTALKFEASDEIASFVAGQELFYNKIIQPDEVLAKIEKVSQADILKIAQDIFRPERISMAVIGRQEQTKSNEEFYKKIFSKI